MSENSVPGQDISEALEKSRLRGESIVVKITLKLNFSL